VIVVNEDNLISGNTVLKPKYSPYRNNEKDREEERNRKARKRQRNGRLKGKVKIIRNIALTFIVGLVLVGRYSIIYNMQKELNSIKSNINTINRENENLKVELVKFNNIQFIEDTAINKLHMVRPDKSLAIYTDLDKEIVQSTEKKKETEEQQNIWNKLKKILF
jgi:cell division protein FtsL